MYIGFGMLMRQKSVLAEPTAVSSGKPDSSFSLAQKDLKLPVEKKIGQMMMVSIPGTLLSTTTAQWLRDRHIGGVILLGKNVVSLEQTKKFIRQLQDNASQAGDPPLLIGVDQEGGMVSRFRFLQELTAQKDILDTESAFQVGLARGKELRELGVHVNFSPVLDVASSSQDFMFSRTFRGDAGQVALLGEAMIRGYEQAGIISVAKHFPGHGGTRVDSHKDLPVKNITYAGLDKELEPFRKAILARVPMIMPAHIKFPRIDKQYPASISSLLIGRMLRTDLGYQGVIITDDLGMGAIMKTYGLPDAGVRAIKAGDDILLVVRSLPEYDKIYMRIKNALGHKEITEQRLDESIRRIMLLKSRVR
ncbi:MAG: beta-N-acetylhexosaminidase [Candidatus Sungbacteria bacterium]|nr:beta-N-acetylhexosaminidase [Candidatus Sungbacteria bacterium]